MKNNFIPRVDSRDQHLHVFGQVVDFPSDIDFDAHLTNPIEPGGAVYCTALSDTDVATDQSKVVYDYLELWSHVPSSAQGADPRDTLGTMIKMGLKPLTSDVRDTRWVSYFRADTGSLDAFDNVRSAMMQAQSSLTVATGWYSNWFVGSEGIVPDGGTIVSYHDYKICGWSQINGISMFKIKPWLGYYMYMPREVFNAAVGKMGMGAYMPSTQVIQAVRRRTLTEYLIDAMKNLVLLLQVQLKSMQTPIVNQSENNSQVIVNHPKIVAWANAVKQVEGWSPTSVSFLHNNPGNLGYSTLTVSWGAQQGNPKADGGHFCKFPDYATGFKALCYFLTLGAENQLLKFHQARTLELFSEKYGNTGIGYAQEIANILGVPLSTDVSTFLT